MFPGLLLAICASLAGPLASRAHEGVVHDIERETRALAGDPTDVTALIARARYYRLDGRLDESLRDLDRAGALAPDDPGVRLQRALTLAALGREQEAEVELDRVLAVSPGSAAGYSERARIRARSDRGLLAIADLTAAIALEPALDRYLVRGRLQEAEGRLDEAAAGYRDGLARLGEALLLRRALIRVEIARAQYDSALRMIDAQIDSGRLRSEWHLQRALVLAAMGRTDDAARERADALARANQALRKRPTSANLLARAEVHLALGDEAAARDDLERALRNSPQLDRARELLAELEAEALAK